LLIYKDKQSLIFKVYIPVNVNTKAIIIYFQQQFEQIYIVVNQDTYKSVKDGELFTKLDRIKVLLETSYLGNLTILLYYIRYI